MSARCRCILPAWFILSTVVLGVVEPAHAHFVPPEAFHPVAESYRRMMFMLNLNPVLWERVREDSRRIADELAVLDPAEAKLYSASAEAIIAPFLHGGDEVPGIEMRKRASRGLFELSTEAVARVICLNLDQATASLGDSPECYARFDAARQVWAAFEHEVKTTDPSSYHDLGLHWLTAAGSIGASGILGVGAVPPDAPVFNAASKAITDYVTKNFQQGYAAPASGRLTPLPLKSDGFDPARAAPLKLPPGSDINKQLPRPRQILNMAERGVDESETPLIALGDMVFDSPYIFGEPAKSLGISCNRCHNKGVTNPNFIVAGLSSQAGGMDVSNSFFAPHANNGHFDPLDIPDLRGIRFTAPYGRNGRTSSLREFTRNVIVHEFNGPEPDPIILDAMIAYLNEFDFLPNPMLNRNGTLSAKASSMAKRGEKLFNKPFTQMDGMSCATCHIPSNHFIDGKRHNIGTAKGSAPYSLDGAFDTPTLLSAKYSPPYFHDGSLATLGDVTAWFNAAYSLDLTDRELSDLTAYLESVGEGVDAMEDTVYILEAEMEEFKFFLSSYEYLKRINRPEIMNTLFQTVALEINAHKWDVQDERYLPVLSTLAELMTEAYEENLSGNRSRVDAIVDEYRHIYTENAEYLK